MMKYRKVFFALFILVAGGLAFYFLRDQSSQVPEAVPSEAPEANAPESKNIGGETLTETAPPMKQGESVEETPSPLPDVDFPNKLDTPDLGTIRNEVEQDPHGTPPSLLEFSSQMATYMEKALGSQENAQEFFPRLEECSTDNSGRQPMSIRAICLVNASRLAKKYPVLDSKFQSLLDSAPENLKDLATASGLD